MRTLPGTLAAPWDTVRALRVHSEVMQCDKEFYIRVDGARYCFPANMTKTFQ